MTIETLKQMPGHLIRRAQQLSTAIFNEKMAEFDLTSVQFIALVAVSEIKGLDATRLAELIHFDRATIGGVIERLERKALIARETSQHDKRIKELAITPAGKAIIAVSFQTVEAVQEELLAPLSAKERVTLLSLLDRVVEASHVTSVHEIS